MPRQKKIKLDTHLVAGGYVRTAEDALRRLEMVLKNSSHKKVAHQVYEDFGRLKSLLDDSFCHDFKAEGGTDPVSPYFAHTKWRNIESGLLPAPRYKIRGLR